MYSDLFLLKNMESLVKEMNSSKEVNLSIKEHLLTSATDMVEFLRTDPFEAFCQPQCDLCKPSSFANPPLPPSPLQALSPAALSSSALSYCSRDEELPTY